MMERGAIEIREATPADAEAIAALLAVAFADLRPQYTAEGYRTTTPDAAEILPRFEEGPIWLALDQERPVGTVSVKRSGNMLYVRSMAVDPDARGRGIASMLLDCVERFARASGCRGLTLSTTPFLHAAIRTYERAGFQRTDEGPTDLAGTPLFTMTKEL